MTKEYNYVDIFGRPMTITEIVDEFLSMRKELEYYKKKAECLESQILVHPGNELIIHVYKDSFWPEENKKEVLFYGPETNRKLSMHNISEVTVIRHDEEEK